MDLGKKILLVVSERIGDVIFCTPAIALLRQQLNDAKIAVIAPSHAAASVFAHNPCVDIVYTAPTKKQLLPLRREYDTVIDLHNSKRTRAYTEHLKLPCCNSPRSKTNQHQSHVASEFIAALLGCSIPPTTRYALYPQPQHFQAVEQLLRSHQVDLTQHILIGCHMGCNQVMRHRWKIWKKTEAHKAWPVENFIALEKQLQQTHPCIRLVLTGSNSEAHLCRKVSQHANQAIDLAGKTSVLDMAALMRYCKVFLTGDTGPLHIACSSEIPVVTLFGPTSPIETGPHPKHERHRVIHQTQMTDITVESVYQNLQTFLS